MYFNGFTQSKHTQFKNRTIACTTEAPLEPLPNLLPALTLHTVDSFCLLSRLIVFIYLLLINTELFLVWGYYE